MNDNHVFASLLQSLAVFKQSSWTTFALSRCQDRELKFTYGCEQKFSEIVICSTSCFLTESFLGSNEDNILFSPDWLIRLSYRLLGFLKRKKKLFQLKVDFFFNINKWTSSNEENWTKFLSQSYGNLTPSLRRSKLTFTLLCALNFLYCSCG